MKKVRVALVLLLSIAAASAVLAQEPPMGRSLGINMNQALSTYGMGINISLPLSGDLFSFRGSANIMGLQAVPDALADRSHLYGYEMIRLGVLGRYMWYDYVKLYVEGGPLLMLNNSLVTSRKISMGGYGLAGMEYRLRTGHYFLGHCWVFLEGGGIGTGAHADRLIGSPAYANGLFFGLGIRYYTLCWPNARD
jgi:hypothetical protein